MAGIGVRNLSLPFRFLAMLVLVPALTAAAISTVRAYSIESADSPSSFAAGPVSYVKCEADEPPQIGVIDYAEGPGITAPDTASNALAEYVSGVGLAVSPDQFDRADELSGAVAYVDEVDGVPKAAAFALESEAGWRITAYSVCGSYVTAHLGKR